MVLCTYLIQERIGSDVCKDGDKPFSLCAASAGSAPHPCASLDVQEQGLCPERVFQVWFSTLVGMEEKCGKSGVCREQSRGC